MHRILKAEAFVLKKKQLLNKDALIVLFTRESGKITAIAKGIRKITSRRIGSLMTGNLISVSLAQSKETHYLQQVRIISLFSRIKKSPVALRQAYFFLYLTDKLLPEMQSDVGVFNRIKKIMIMLSAEPFSRETEWAMCKDFLKLCGYPVPDESATAIIQRIEEIIGRKIPPILYN